MSDSLGFNEQLLLLVLGIFFSGIGGGGIAYFWQRKQIKFQKMLEKQQKKYELKKQDKKQEHEVKNNIAVIIGESTTKLTRSMSLGLFVYNDNEKKEIFREWRRQTAIIGSLMRGYFTEKNVSKDPPIVLEWDELFRATNRFYILFEGLVDSDTAKKIISELKDCLNYMESDDWKIIQDKFVDEKIVDEKILLNSWDKIQKEIKDKKYELIKKIFNTNMPVFNDRPS